VGFDTTKAVVPTEKSHVNYVTVDSGYEEKVAAVLESMDDVVLLRQEPGTGLCYPLHARGLPSNSIPTSWCVSHAQVATRLS